MKFLNATGKKNKQKMVKEWLPFAIICNYAEELKSQET